MGLREGRSKQSSCPFFFFCIFPLLLTVLFVFQCSWPIGYEELIFFDRDAISCNWDESSLVKQDTPTLMELSLYTPPVTPGGELSKELTETASMEYSSNLPMEDKLGRTLPKQESIGSNVPPLFKSLELDCINSSEEHRRNSVKEQIADNNICRTLPKIINVEKTNINLTVVSNSVGKQDDTKTGNLLTDAIIPDTLKNLDMSNDVCTKFGLSTQYNTESEQSTSGKLHSDATVSGMETNFDAEALSKTLVDVNVTNNSNSSNESIANISIGDINIDTLLQDVLNENLETIEMNNDWLTLFMS